MCGIAGAISLSVGADTQTRMLKTMARRGPDGSGCYRSGPCTLLHSRLAIIDPAGGAQPMKLSWAGETYCLVYNGELYNTQEVRTALTKTGHTFLGHSDTEVVLHAYAQYGSECVEHFNGIFAFAVWEENAQRLFLARDRIGVKPLFYMQCAGGLLFSSEIKTILAHPAAKPRLDAQGAAQLLLLGPGKIPGSGVFRDVRELKPGFWALWEGGRLTVRQYWKLRDREHRETFPETVEVVRTLVLDAIRAQMVSDVPIGTFLSGGLDSSIISAVCAGEMAQRGQKLHTFSVDYRDNDRFFVPGKFQPNSDSSYISLMEAHLGSLPHRTVLTPEDLLGVLEESTQARDLPGMADVDFSLLAFCREIRKDVKVALSGECADEIFGGYPWYRDPEVRAQAGFPWAQNTDRRAKLLSQNLAGQLQAQDFVMDACNETLSQCDILPSNSPTEKRMKEMVNLNFAWFMQTLLDRKDRMSMYCSLEVRVPFCDYRIAEYLYAVPWDFKDYQGREKGLLRQAVANLLPPEVLHRKKSPYPKTFDPAYEALVSSRLRAVLDDPDSLLGHLVNISALRGLLDEHSPWPWYGQLMAGPQTMAWFLQLDYWLRSCRPELLF